MKLSFRNFDPALLYGAHLDSFCPGNLHPLAAPSVRAKPSNDFSIECKFYDTCFTPKSKNEIEKKFEKVYENRSAFFQAPPGRFHHLEHAA
jgi:hypothetical protein